MSVAAAIERRTPHSWAALVPAAAVAVAMTSLLVRLVPDISGKPLYEDEAVAGLIAARPLGDMLHTVVLDRGGAPLHFLLAHGVFVLDTSPAALRWLSLVFALATVPLCYDIARRLAGHTAGVTAAALAATSQLLLIYGTFGRMYSLFACSSALAVDLFVRAVIRPTRETALAAAAAALLPLASHPFGAFVFGAELVVAALLWRGRNVRPAVPVIGVALLALPLVLTDLRLSDRYGAEGDVPGGHSPGAALVRALGGSAGGYRLLFGLFVVLAAIGLVAVARGHGAVALFFCLVIAAPPALLVVASALGATADRLSPRHLIFVLPVWTTLVAAGSTWIASRLPSTVRVAVPVAVITAAALAPSAVSDPRTIPTGGRAEVSQPAAWVRANVSGADVLYPYSPLFLAALPDAAAARAYPREAVSLSRLSRRTGVVRRVLVSLPLAAPLGEQARSHLRRDGVNAHLFASWLILSTRGPSRDGRAAIADAARMLGSAAPALRAAPSTSAYLQQLRGTACVALQRLDSSC